VLCIPTSITLGKEWENPYVRMEQDRITQVTLQVGSIWNIWQHKFKQVHREHGLILVSIQVVLSTSKVKCPIWPALPSGGCSDRFSGVYGVGCVYIFPPPFSFLHPLWCQAHKLWPSGVCLKSGKGKKSGKFTNTVDPQKLINEMCHVSYICKNQMKALRRIISQNQGNNLSTQWIIGLRLK